MRTADSGDMELHLLRLGTVAGLGAPVPGYLIRTDEGLTVLVDTGYRDGAVTAGGPRVEVAEADDVVRRLAALGVRPADVDVVVCSHMDPDHAGNHDRFPGATFVVQRTHHAFARSGAEPRLERSRPTWDLPHLHYRSVDGDTTLAPGIELVASGGHVPGHQSVLVRLPEQGAVLLAIDAIPMAVAADPQRRPIFPFDLDGQAVRDSTRKLVDLAAAEDALVVYGHDPRQWAQLRTSPDCYR